MKRTRLRSLVPDRVEEAMAGLTGGFSWDETKEGGEYWTEVYHKLRAMLEEKEEN